MYNFQIDKHVRLFAFRENDSVHFSLLLPALCKLIKKQKQKCIKYFYGGLLKLWKTPNWRHADNLSNTVTYSVPSPDPESTCAYQNMGLLWFKILGQLAADRHPAMMELFRMQGSRLAASCWWSRSHWACSQEVEVSPQQWAIWTLKGRMQNTENQSSGTSDMYQQIGLTDALVVLELTQRWLTQATGGG